MKSNCIDINTAKNLMYGHLPDELREYIFESEEWELLSIQCLRPGLYTMQGREASWLEGKVPGNLRYDIDYNMYRWEPEGRIIYPKIDSKHKYLSFIVGAVSSSYINYGTFKLTDNEFNKIVSEFKMFRGTVFEPDPNNPGYQREVSIWE